MKTKPVLSIIIVTWNTAPITAKCIQTINDNLSGKISFEIILADNGSTDNTASLVKDLPNVNYFNTGSNLGFSKGNNLAAQKATGEYLFFLNSDMELVDDSLLSMLKFLQDTPDTAIVGPKFLNPDLTPQGSAFPDQSPINAFKQFWLGLRTYSKYIPDTDKPVSVWAVSGGAMLMSRKFFQAVQGWDESYFMYFEDLEICRLARKLFFKIYYYPGCSVVHHHGASGAHQADSSNQWRRLIPSSIKYHGRFTHNLINFIIWSGQKFRRLFHLAQIS